MESIWLKTAQRPDFEALKGNIKTDVLIIGGGITGILCAYMLKQAGVSYILVEANRICDGITKNTTAKITVQHRLIYDKLIRMFGIEAAQLYLQAQQTALEKYRAICRNIDCDFEEYDSFVYSIDNRKKIENEVTALNKLEANANFVEELPLPFSIAGAVQIEKQAQFHPLKFAFSIAKDLNIMEHTRAIELTPTGTLTNNGNIMAEKIIVATHFPFLNKHGSYFIKLYQHRSYVLALKNAENVHGMYVDEAEKGLSFRNYKNLLLIGGGSHRTGKKGSAWHGLEEFAESSYPYSQVICRWATQDCMTLDGAPYIGQYSKRTPNLYVATGFNKWGMTSSMVAAIILTDLVQGKYNPYASVFSPSRSILHPQLAINVAETAMGMLKPVIPRCPHMGCALKYNPDERSWDCPCHGSRFTQDGKLIDNPSTGDRKR